MHDYRTMCLKYPKVKIYTKHQNGPKNAGLFANSCFFRADSFPGSWVWLERQECFFDIIGLSLTSLPCSTFNRTKQLSYGIYRRWKGGKNQLEVG